MPEDESGFDNPQLCQADQVLCQGRSRLMVLLVPRRMSGTQPVCLPQLSEEQKTAFGRLSALAMANQGNKCGQDVL